MIRWRFLIVRLVIVIAFLTLVRYTASPVAHWIAVRTLQGATGAKVELGETEIGLFPLRLSLRDLKIADPRKEMRNLLEFEQALLAIDGKALLHRRYELAAAKLSGVRIGAARTSSGFLEPQADTEVEESSEPSVISQWCERIGEDLKDQAEGFGASLETVQQADRIRRYWEAEYSRLRQTAKQVEDDIRTIKTVSKQIENPLRDLPAIQESLRRAEQIKLQLIAIREKLDSLPVQVRGDIGQLRIAKENDRQRIRQMIPFDLQQKGVKVAPELLQKIVQQQLEEVRGYLESGRSIAEATVVSPKQPRERGICVELGQSLGPWWLIRRCEIDGFLSINDQQYRMVGMLEHLTSDHSRREHPFHARLRLNGPRLVRVDFYRHYPQAGGVENDADRIRDQLKIHWPQLDLPQQKLGDRDELALVMAGGKLEVWVEIESVGKQLTGRLVSRQQETQLDLVAKPKLERNVVIQSLRRSLAEIHDIEVDARFTGTWRDMDLHIATNLTEHLSEGLRIAAAESLEAVRQKLVANLEQEYQQQTRQLDQWLTAQQGEARAVVAKADELIETISQKGLAELGGANAYLGRLRSGVTKGVK